MLGNQRDVEKRNAIGARPDIIMRDQAALEMAPDPLMRQQHIKGVLVSLASLVATVALMYLMFFPAQCSYFQQLLNKLGQ